MSSHQRQHSMFPGIFTICSILNFRRWGLLLAVTFLCFPPTTRSQVFLKDQFPHLFFNAPIGLYHPKDSTNRLCVVERGGVIRIFPNDSSTMSSSVFLDIHDSVISGGELGLLGLAFHPDYATNGLFYVDYTRDNPLRTVISRFHVSTANPDSADPASEVILLEQLQPFINHNGGQLAFGPDGYLYIAFGDGGGSGDPFENGQDKSTLLGKILRINVDSTVGLQHYAIPPDNPFSGDTTKKQEIFAYGLRNPWRFSFDQHTLWCADVGQDSWEEIDTIIKGGNYGWNVMEGKHCFSPSSGCDTNTLKLPLWEYSHNGGRCSVTGGFVYRGAAMPSLIGKYVYGDYCSGEIWTLTPGSSPSNSILVEGGASVSSFGEDVSGEIYVCDIGGGKVYKLWATPPGPFTLIAPAENAMNQPNILTCVWTSSPEASTYRLEIAPDSSFTSTVVDDSMITDTVRPVGPLPDSTLFFWRVRATNSVGASIMTPVRRFTTGLTSVQYYVMKSWNLISIPLGLADGRKTTLFPSASSNAFIYDPADGYEVRDTLTPGIGYWLMFNDSATLALAGTAVNVDTVEVVPGWNVIGSLSQSIPLTQVSSIPGGIVTSSFFAYQGYYVQSSTIDPGKGYWVKVSQAAKLILSLSPAVLEGAGRIRIEPTAEVPPPAPGNSGSQYLPKEYFLAQNYPNPFNPSTTMHYFLPVPGRVTLKMYNTLGQEVGTAIDGMQTAGYKSVHWDASHLPSGFYFYRLTVGSFADIKKMLLVR